LIGTKEATATLDVSTSTFQNFRDRPDFPAPQAVLGQGALWLRSDIETWHVNRQEQRVKALLDDLGKRLANLDPATRAELLKQLQ
jgi:predicted DNA-binding transcriptional regulator AlpA